MRQPDDEARIFVFGYYGRGNCGDDAMLFGLLRECLSLSPRLKFVVLMGDKTPAIPSEACGKVIFVPAVWFRVIEEIAKSSAFIIAGGTHISDYGKVWRVFKQLNRILLLVLFSRLLGKKVALIAQGLGPLAKGWATLSAKAILSLAHYLSVRDTDSERLATQLLRSERAQRTFDLAAILVKNSLKSTRFSGKEFRVLGVSITPSHQVYGDKGEFDQIVVSEMAKALVETLTRHVDWSVNLFVFHAASDLTEDHDHKLTERLAEAVGFKERIAITEYVSDPLEMLHTVGRCSAMIGMKYHACLFAFLRDVPLVIVPYHPKCQSLGHEIGMKSDAILTMEDLLAGQAATRLESLISSPLAYSARLGVADASERASSGIAAFLQSLEG